MTSRSHATSASAPVHRSTRRKGPEELGLREVGVEPALFDQLVVRAPLDDPAVVEHEDLVGFPNSGEAMGDDDRRAADQRISKGILDVHFGLGVEVRRGLVENHQSRVA